MAPEVRRLPLWTIAVFVLLALPILPSLSLSEQNKPSIEKEPAPEAKARLLQELDRQIEDRRRDLAREEESLTALKRALEAAKQELLKEKERFEELRGQVEADAGKKGKAGDERTDQVAKVYQAMKPKEAAEALEKMDEDLAVAILAKLPNRTVGKVFDVMNKDRVRSLTVRMQQSRGGGAGSEER